MLDWMRGKRFDLKTSIVILVIAFACWAIFSYVNIRDFVPAEFTDP